MVGSEDSLLVFCNGEAAATPLSDLMQLRPISILDPTQWEQMLTEKAFV